MGLSTLVMLTRMGGEAEISLAAQPAGVPSRPVPDFSLPDQFGHTRDIKFPGEKIMLLTVADRKGAKEIETWIAPIRGRYGHDLQIEGIADVSSAPAGMHRLVRNAIREQITYPIMLDWKGDIAKSFRYQRGHANIYILNPKGQIIWQHAGPASEEGIHVLLRLLDQHLGQTESRTPTLLKRDARPDTGVSR